MAHKQGDHVCILKCLIFSEVLLVRLDHVAHVNCSRRVTTMVASRPSSRLGWIAGMFLGQRLGWAFGQASEHVLRCTESSWQCREERVLVHTVCKADYLVNDTRHGNSPIALIGGVSALAVPPVVGGRFRGFTSRTRVMCRAFSHRICPSVEKMRPDTRF